MGQAIENIAFGELVVDVGGRRVLRSGQRVAMGPQEFKLLETLIANRGRVLTGDELRILVWSDDPSKKTVPAGDVNALYVSIRKLRAALGDHGKYILNIPKVGYTIAEAPFAVHESIAPEIGFSESSPFIGRDAEIDQILTALDRSRIVTLTGPPGIGKSRLAVETTKRFRKTLDGVFVVELAAVADGAFLSKTALTCVGIPEHSDRDALTELIDSLRDQRYLLVLDNCDHLIKETSEFVDQVLRSCREIRILATSREPLLVPGETVIGVGPLAMPTGPETGALEYDAVRLFIELAKQRRPDFEIGKREVGSVVELCRQLEGIPVAIELAAVQVDAYTVDQILSVMKDRLRILQRRGGDATRHQTLDGAISWSYELLSEPEKLLLQRLSVFSGGWTTDMVTAVCSGEGIVEEDVVHLLAGLVRRSLIQLGRRNGFHRYRMLEMIRQFARQRLIESGEEARMRRRHTAEFLKLAETAFEAGEKDDWPALIEAEYDNIRAVLRRTVTLGEDIAAGLLVCGALVRFWFNHGHLNEARTWTSEALTKDDGSNLTARGRALVTAGFFFGQMPGSSSDALQGRAHFEEALGIFRELGDSRNAGFALQGYSFLLNRLGEFEEAISRAEDAVAIFRPINDHPNTARAANNLGLTLMDMGDFPRAVSYFDLALTSARTAKDLYLEAVLLHNLGDTSFLTGDPTKASDYLNASLELFTPLEHRALEARTLVLMGEVSAAAGETAAALEQQTAALRKLADLGDNQGIAWALEAIGSTLAVSKGDDAVLAAELLAAADALRRRISIRLGPSRQRLVDETVDLLTRKIGPETLAEIWKNELHLHTSEAVEKALSLE